MTNEEMLKKVREDRPERIIHRVFDFKKNRHGFYDVYVDMQTNAVELGWLSMPAVKHVKTRIPYPLSEYNKLSKQEQLDYRWSSI